MKVNKEEELEKFEIWLFEMDDRLEPLLDYAEKKGYSLDYSLDSLAIFEKFVESEKINFDHDLFITCARYLGEVVVKTFNGKWSLDIEDPNSLYFKKPVVINYSKYGTIFSPINILKNYTREYKKGLLLKAILSDIEPGTFNLNNYPTEE
ncbi:hypothetical protein [Pedobacter sp. UYP1]|uniref:hypothetical protein n=1 Tax=Pedobacter sp. UYP1 TaxID=1756396 RepID=UPI0033972CE5